MITCCSRNSYHDEQEYESVIRVLNTEQTALNNNIKYFAGHKDFIMLGNCIVT